MKRNVFYVFAGIVALLEVGLLWFAIDLNNALLIQAGLVVGIVLVYLVRRTVCDVIEDERSTLISQKSALRTLEIFWVVSFLISMGSVVIGFNRPFFPPSSLPSYKLPAHRYFWIFPAGLSLSDDLPVCRIQDLFLPQLRRVRNR